MSHDLMRTLLDVGVPDPPTGLHAPAASAIRSRARRRRARVAAGAAACLLAATAAAVAVRSHLDVTPAQSAAPPAGWTPAWTTAAVSRDGRTVTVAGGPLDATNACASSTVPVRTEADPVVLTATVPDRQCRFVTTFVLDPPLGDRSIVDGSDGGHRPVLHERMLPVPTYPAVGHGTAHVGNKAGHGWSIMFQRGDTMDIHLRAVSRRIADWLPDGERITVQGRTMVISPSRGYTADWLEQDWRFTLVVQSRLPTPTVTRAQLQRVLDGLVWE